MRYLPLIIAAAIISAPLAAVNKLDPKSEIALAMIKQARKSRAIDNQRQVYLPSIIKLEAGHTVDELETQGVKVMRSRDNLVLAFVPTDHIDQLVTFGGIQRINLGQRLCSTLDVARPFGNVDQVVTPTAEWPDGWNGHGVVTGLCDIGFDPHHPTFNDAEGATRVKRLVDYRDTLAAVTRLTTPSLVDAWTTDDIEEWHATHVAGIMSGSYSANGYNGIAAGSDIVVATSMLTDACILDGVEEIIDYAREVGRPAVVNLSLGSYTGPHDGTSLFNQYMAKLGTEAIICMSSGNEGRSSNTLQLQFSDQVSQYSTDIADAVNWNSMRVIGNADFWSADDRRFKMKISIYDHLNDVYVYESPWIDSAEQSSWSIASDGFGDGNSVRDVAFSGCVSGYFMLSSEVNPENGRFNTSIALDIRNSEMYSNEGRYFTMVSISGDPGVSVNCYADGYQCYFSSGWRGLKHGNSVMSVSDIACGDNVIVVGAASTRNTVPRLNGTVSQYDFTLNAIANFTGYGTLADGRHLPHISAPGNQTISSISTPYVEAHPSCISGLAAQADYKGGKVYWQNNGGTSMSSPYVAGIIALWLQADPSLTVAEALEITRSTAVTDFADIADPRWGAGEIDALAGMRRVVGLSGVSDVASPSVGPAISVTRGMLRVVWPGVGNVSAKLHSIDGRLVKEVSNGGDSCEIDVSALDAAIYIVTLSTPQGVQKSVKIKL